MEKKNVLIIGSGGRDFHNFNTYYRDNEAYNVVGFTVGTQIPGILDRVYPAELAGKLYPKGIPNYYEGDLAKVIKDLKVDDVAFSYSDVSFQHVLTLGAIAQGAGANYVLLGPDATQIKSSKPVVAVGAVRTGAGKSQTSRAIIENLMGRGLKVVAVRHPMPYGDLNAQKVMRFAEISDLEKHNCTVEEMEEFEPHVTRGNVIYCGVDYAAILEQVENDPDGCDVILWDGGNNDFPFYEPDLMVTVVDPLRPEPRAHVLAGRGHAQAGRRRRHQQDRQRDPGRDRDRAQERRGGRPERHGHRRGVAALGRRSVADQGQARPRDRGRPHRHARRHDDRCREGRGDEVRRSRARRPAAVPQGQPRRHVQALPARHRHAPGRGLRRPDAEGHGGHRECGRLRRGDRRNADRPGPHHQHQEAVDARVLRPAGDRPAESRTTSSDDFVKKQGL